MAPIALYPDSLVAQILTASTYPQQISDADNWSHQTAGMPPQQRADIANTMPWDPSVKALTAFPAVLDNLARNQNWTSALGNAYYNQPGDVMNAVQAARVQAQQAGYLRSTPQQRVYYDGGQILIAPVNPDLVYVPYYNPWRIYGRLGFALCRLLCGSSDPWDLQLGWDWDLPRSAFPLDCLLTTAGVFTVWAPNWRGGPVFYNHAAYYSRSATVYNHGHFGGYNRGVFEHAGRGVPANFHPGAAREIRAAHRPGGRPAIQSSTPDRQPGPAGARLQAGPWRIHHAAAAHAQAARAQAARPAAHAASKPSRGGGRVMREHRVSRGGRHTAARPRPRLTPRPAGTVGGEHHK